MVLSRALDWYCGRLGRLRLLCLMVLAGIIVTLTASRPAAAETNPCSHPPMGSASVHATLQVQTHGLDRPSFTSTTQITVPPAWQGTIGLFENEQQQGSSLSCFMPITQEEYQSAPPSITIEALTPHAKATVNITNTIIMADGPEANSSWTEGFWSVTKNPSGYQVTFQRNTLAPYSGHVQWTATLKAPGLNMMNPSPQPTIDDGDGTWTWTFPQSESEPKVKVSLISPWQVRMNLASNHWPMRLVSDASWTLNDGAVVDIVGLFVAWWLWRGKRATAEQRRLSRAVGFISLLSLIGYIGYVADDYYWHHFINDPDAVWKCENLALVAIASLYFFRAFGIRWKWVIAWSVVSVGATLPIAILWHAPVSDYYMGSSSDYAVGKLLILLIPILLALVFATTGTVLWISRFWPFGKKEEQFDEKDKKEEQVYLRELKNTPFGRKSTIAFLLLGMLVLGVCILGQSAVASHYFWQHSDLWGQGPTGLFSWVTSDLLTDVHWWISDGIQWGLGFAVIVGIFAVLRALSADARGVFFCRYPTDEPVTPKNSESEGGKDEPKDRGDLVLMAAIASSLFVGIWGFYDGTWGFYDGVSIPLPCIVAFVGLVGCGLTRRLSKLDWGGWRENRKRDSRTVEAGSVLVDCRKDFLAASARGESAMEAQQDPTTLQSKREQTSGRLVRIMHFWREHRKRPKVSANQDGEAAQCQALAELEISDPGATALELGPADTWWDNGVAAVEVGWYLLIFPIAFDIYIGWNTGKVSLIGYPFGLQDAFGAIISIVIGWVSGIFMFGVLMPYWRGIRTPIKGAIFGLIAFASFAADAGVRQALGVTPNPVFVVDGLLAVVLFGTVGLLLDVRTLRVQSNLSLSSIYRLGGVRVAVTYVTTLIIVALGLWQAIYLTSLTTQQRAQTISSTSSYFQSVGGARLP